ncbi:MAG: hypothetical protein ACI9FB_004422, partial [Candidatus Azotimanducaceae bacterium]
FKDCLDDHINYLQIAPDIESEATLADTAKCLQKHGRWTNMKQDKDTPLLKYGCYPAVGFNIRGYKI